MRLIGKVVVVTGASTGIGEAIARKFAEEGASVVLASRDHSRVEAARERVGYYERTLAVACDIRQREQIVQLLQATLEHFGHVDVWMNNAGHGLQDSVAQMDMQQCRQMFDTNLFGAIEGMQVAIPVMQKQGKGTIINISSIAGHIAVPYMAAYSATKHALNAIGKAARVELMGTGVHVMTVCPGYIATDFAANAVKGKERQRLNRAGEGISAERVANAVFRGYLKRKREIVVPWRDRIVIFLYRTLPGVVDSAMKRRLRPADDVTAEAEAGKSGP
jgi:short-subunit dehydrogenase